MKTYFSILFAALVLMPCTTSLGQESDKKAGFTLKPKVAWYGRLSDGLAEAKRTNRPIFLLSAAPQCEGVPGMW